MGCPYTQARAQTYIGGVVVVAFAEGRARGAIGARAARIKEHPHDIYILFLLHLGIVLSNVLGRPREDLSDLFCFASYVRRKRPSNECRIECRIRYPVHGKRGELRQRGVSLATDSDQYTLTTYCVQYY